MNLFDESLGDKVEVAFASTGSAIKAKQTARDDLEKEIAEFLARGGSISEEPLKKPKKDIFEPGQGGLEDFPPDTKKRNRKKGKGGHENVEITKLKDGGQNYKVIIANISYGTYGTPEEAVERRDKVRALLKMRPAED